MSNSSMEQTKTRYTAAMGEELGSIFFGLYCRLVELHMLWQQYRQLYGSDEENVRLLNRTAGLFFKVVQDELWDSVLLGISRMTDPAATGRRRNLTIHSLSHLVADPALRDEVASLSTEATLAAEFAREHRNRRIAHHDYNFFINRSSAPLNGISRSLVEQMLEKLRRVLNRVDNAFCDNTVMYQDFIDDSGARVLLYKLKSFETLRNQTGQADRSSI